MESHTGKPLKDDVREGGGGRRRRRCGRRRRRRRRRKRRSLPKSMACRGRGIPSKVAEVSKDGREKRTKSNRFKPISTAMAEADKGRSDPKKDPPPACAQSEGKAKSTSEDHVLLSAITSTYRPEQLSSQGRT